jgi:hypothetical protein
VVLPVFNWGVVLNFFWGLSQFLSYCISENACKCNHEPGVVKSFTAIINQEQSKHDATVLKVLRVTICPCHYCFV